MLEGYKLSNVATYDKNGISVTDLKPVNFFYGANGCGKTTTSDFLADLHNPKYKSCSVSWKNGVPLRTLVYNKKFRDLNFRPSGDISGVFTLGEASVEEQALVAEKSKKLSEISDNLATKKKTLEAKLGEKEDFDSSFAEECWDVQKKYKDDFKAALRGSMRGKNSFRDNVMERKFKMPHGVKDLSHQQLKEKGETLLGKKPEALSIVPELNENGLLKIERYEIWKKVIIGQKDVEIAGLIEHLGNNDWVISGLKYVDGETCPFCQKSTIDDQFLKQISDYFDTSFQKNTEIVAELAEQYEHEATRYLDSLSRTIYSAENDEKTKLNLTAIKSAAQLLERQLTANTTSIQTKIEKPSAGIELIDNTETFQTINTIIDEANKFIVQHNKIVNDFNNEQLDYFHEVWAFIIQELSTNISNHEKRSLGLEKAINGINKVIKDQQKQEKALREELKELSKNTTSVQPTVDEINRMLQAYGFVNFKIVPSVDNANNYSLQRENGELALDTLSEGEVTFITFLYFIQLAKGGTTRENVVGDRILVIDDPISSLDSNILFIVSTIIKNVINEVKDGSHIKQLLLFTHNVYFHKEASFQGGRSNGCNKTNYWILRKKNNTTNIQAYGQNNPIESSYELLWKEISEPEKLSLTTVQNTMRRILENYFKILGRYSDNDIVEKFTDNEEKQMCKSLLYWINDGSHCIPDDLFIENQDQSMEGYLHIFKKVFEYSGHISHYNMMMGIPQNNTLAEVEPA